MISVPTTSLEYGFANGPGGTHTSRTMMLQELDSLLKACPADSEYQDYEDAILVDNVLLKQTASTRKRTLRGLRELYSLDANVPLFRAMRELWQQNSESQPLLALLCATARDPLLRASSPIILDTPLGGEVTPIVLADAVEEVFPGRYNPSTLAKIGRNAASSWQQSGHLEGRVSKHRTKAAATPAGTAYALLLGHLCDVRGQALLETLWARLLDSSTSTLQELAVQASRQGWLEYRHAGSVTEISFHYLLRAE